MAFPGGGRLGIPQPIGISTPFGLNVTAGGLPPVQQTAPVAPGVLQLPPGPPPGLAQAFQAQAQAPIRPIFSTGGGIADILTRTLAGALGGRARQRERKAREGRAKAITETLFPGLDGRKAETGPERLALIGRLLGDEDISLAAATAQIEAGMQQRFNVLTPQQEITTFGSDRPGQFQQSSTTGEIRQVSGTAPVAGRVPAPLTTLISPEGERITLRRDDPEVDLRLKRNFTEESRVDETAFDEGIGKAFAADFEASRSAATVGRTIIARANVFDAILDQAEITGATTPITMPVAAFFRDIGFDVGEDVPLQEALSSIAINFTLDFISRTKGAISNQEMVLFMQAAPGLARTPEGNRLIVEILRSQANRDVERARIWNQGIEDGVQPTEIIRRISDFEDRSSIIPADFRTRINAVSGRQIFGPSIEELQQNGVENGQMRVPGSGFVIR